MNTYEAISYVLKEEGISKYKLAHEIAISPIMVSNYLTKGTRMRKDTAARFKARYNIDVTDSYPPAPV